MTEKRGVNMRVGVFVGILCLLLVAGLILPAIASDRPQDEYEGVLRFHVKANSDSAEDQELKMAVKDEVFSKIERGITETIKECKEREESEGNETYSPRGISPEEFRRKKTIEYIDENLRNIERWAKDCVTKMGYDYQVTAKVGVTPMPGKEYDGIYFPPGNYNALTITIGEGRGQNWWCVIFPPLCLVDCQDSEYKDAFGVDEGGRLVLKSKIVETLSARKTKPKKTPPDDLLPWEGEMIGAMTDVKKEYRPQFCGIYEE